MSEHSNRSETTMFDFSDSNSELNFYIGDNYTTLNIKRINDSIAILYFTDDLNNHIDIPTEIKIYTFDFNDTKKRVIQTPVTEQLYTLCWSENYIVEFNDNIILNIESQRHWNIAGIPPVKQGRFLRL